MKKIAQISSVLALSAAVAAPAMADISANVGLVSDYFYRGVDQGVGATGSFGLDWEEGGFYLGTWAADVSDGAEVDLYGGYIAELGDFTIGAGLTGYYYTGDFDQTYEEVNLYAGFKFLSLEYSVGKHETTAGDEEDYTYLAATIEHNGFYGTYGTYGSAFDGNHFDLGYGTEVGGFDVSTYVTFADDDLTGSKNGDASIVFGLSKTFDL